MKKQHTKPTTQSPYVIICCEVLQGVKPFALQEIQKSIGQTASLLSPQHNDSEAIFLRYSGDAHVLLHLRTVVAVYLVEYFPIARPRALLGHQNYQRLLEQVRHVQKLNPTRTFSGFRISAAGENSTVYSTLREKLSEDIQLPYNPDEGDLLLRIRPSSLQTDGWEVMVRLSPRPLSTRTWRIHNMKGALNATLAAAMIDMSQPQPSDRFLNMMCGSGTLLVERVLQGPAAVIVGVDTNVEALRGALKNMSVERSDQHILLLNTDATRTPFLEETFDVICADLPWGQLVGSHEQNVSLYPQFFDEVTRIATASARLVVLTHEVTLFERVLLGSNKHWTLRESIQVFQGGLHPKIYMLLRVV